MTRIKICGLYRPQDIEAVNEARPDYAGFIINFPKSHRNLSPQVVKALRAGLAPEIKSVGVIVDQPEEIAASLISEGIVDILQLHGHETADDIRRLKDLTGAPVWKAYRIRSAQDLHMAEESPADLIILDNGYGTGQVFDWQLLEQVSLSRPYLLAGGMTPDNIPEAIHTMHPYGIDISSGIETDKLKDPRKIMAAVAACRR